MTDALLIGATGANFSAPSGSALASAAIPVDASGGIPKYVRVSVASGAIYFKLAKGAATAAVTDTLIAVSDSQIISCAGCDHFSAWGIGGIIVGTITPLENAA